MSDNQKIHGWITKQIIELLIQQNITVPELADQCNLSPQTIQDCLNGKSVMRLENIITIAVALSGTLNKFFSKIDKTLYQELSKEIQKLK